MFQLALTESTHVSMLVVCVVCVCVRVINDIKTSKGLHNNNNAKYIIRHAVYLLILIIIVNSYNIRIQALHSI